MHLRSLLPALLGTLFTAAYAPHASAFSSRWLYVDEYNYFTDDAQFDAWYTMTAQLEQDFDEICGDTFCEGDYSNIMPLRLSCSVEHRSGRIGHCIWTFAASNETVDPHDGRIDVETHAWHCELPLAPLTTIETLQAALADGSPLYATLPGTEVSIYDGLTDCL
jgi:hypothetical protein